MQGCNSPRRTAALGCVCVNADTKRLRTGATLTHPHVPSFAEQDRSGNDALCGQQAADLEQPEHLGGPGVGLELAAGEGHGAVGVEGQDGLVGEAAGVLQGLLVEGRLVALHHHLEGDPPHCVALLEAVVLQRASNEAPKYTALLLHDRAFGNN